MLKSLQQGTVMLVTCGDRPSMDFVLRRLQAEEVSQVVEIEKEAFSPLWVSTPFKRDLNNRYASYLVARCVPKDEKPEDQSSQDTATYETGDFDMPSSQWRRVASKVQGLLSKRQNEVLPSPFIAGYVSVWYQGEEAHITEIAVREKLRGRGAGELLLIGALMAAIEYGSKVMTLEARVSNFVAQRLYEKYGFKSVGLRKGYYSDNREDAVIMTTSPIDSEDYQKMFVDLQETYQSRWGEMSISISR